MINNLGGIGRYLGVAVQRHASGLDSNDLLKILRQARLNKFGKVLDPINEANALKNPEVLDGKRLNSLSEYIHTYKLKSGDFVAAATDIGFGRSRNEDRVAVHPSGNGVIVVDGLGLGGGGIVAQVVAEVFCRRNGIVDDYFTKECLKDILEKEVNGDVGAWDAACFASCKIEEDGGKKIAKINIVGDCKVLIFGKNGFKFESDEQSLVYEMVSDGRLTPDEALYHPDRNVVYNSIKSSGVNDPLSYEREVEEGGIIFVVSDGISDNLTPDEIWKLIKDHMDNPKKVIEILSDVTDDRMKNCSRLTRMMSYEARASAGVYPDGFSSKPKKDNIGVGVIRVN